MEFWHVSQLGSESSERHLLLLALVDVALHVINSRLRKLLLAWEESRSNSSLPSSLSPPPWKVGQTVLTQLYFGPVLVPGHYYYSQPATHDQLHQIYRVKQKKDRPEDRSLWNTTQRSWWRGRRVTAADVLRSAVQVWREPAEDDVVETVRNLQASNERHVIDGIERRR